MAREKEANRRGVFHEPSWLQRNQFPYYPFRYFYLFDFTEKLCYFDEEEEYLKVVPEPEEAHNEDESESSDD